MEIPCKHMTGVEINSQFLCLALVHIAGNSTNVNIEHCFSASVVGIVSAMTIMLGPDIKANSAYGKLLKAKKEGVDPTFGH